MDQVVQGCAYRRDWTYSRRHVTTDRLKLRPYNPFALYRLLHFSLPSVCSRHEHCPYEHDGLGRPAHHSFAVFVTRFIHVLEYVPGLLRSQWVSSMGSGLY